MTFSKKQKERNKPKNLILLYLNLFYFISFFNLFFFKKLNFKFLIKLFISFLIDSNILKLNNYFVFISK
jgi:hypothetical protein